MKIFLIALLIGLTWSFSFSQTNSTDLDLYAYAQTRKSDLQLSVLCNCSVRAGDIYHGRRKERNTLHFKMQWHFKGLP